MGTSALPSVTATIEDLRAYVPGKPPEQVSRELGIRSALKLASNENALGTSPKALSAAAQAVCELHRYPDANAYELRQALATHLGVSPNSLVFGNGSNELIELVLRTFTSAGDHVVFADPSFVVYRSASLAHGVSFSAVPLSQGTHDLVAMAEAVCPETKLVFIANPNNPTGTHVGRASLERFLSSVPASVIICLDEAYFEYVSERVRGDAVSLLSLHPGLVVLRTFSKAYGLASLRVGYAVTSARLADYLNRVRPPFNVSHVAQRAAFAALADAEFLSRVVTLNAAERPRVALALEALRCEVLPSEANFLYVVFAQVGFDVGAALLDKGIIVRPMASDGLTLRISIGRPDENDQMLAVVTDLLGK